MAKPNYRCSFKSELFRVPGEGGWVFAVRDEKDHEDSVDVVLEYSIEYRDYWMVCSRRNPKS